MQFGTDGIRGVAGDDVTSSLAFALGRAVARTFPDGPVVVGCDTRESSGWLLASVIAGLNAEGATVRNLGVMPTPAVAVVAEGVLGSGVVVSASHNPYADNGLKVFGPLGAKLDRAAEESIETLLNGEFADESYDGPFDLPELYLEGVAYYYALLKSRVPGQSLAGLKVVIDCANGAASYLAPQLFSELGCDLTVLHAEPNGTNINEACGSTHPDDLIAAVRTYGADLGLAFDGDADRCVAVDATGVLRDGDDQMVVFATDLHARGGLRGTLVVTSMSNLGLRRAMRAANVALRETDVGDKYVLAALEEHDLPFGGEQSGHLIFRSLSPTGDGVLTGLLLCDLVRRRGPLGELCDELWHRSPQQLWNIERDAYDEHLVDDLVREALAAAGVALEDARVVIRPSGTEPVVRVMLECDDARVLTSLDEALRQRLGEAVRAR